MKAPGSQVAAHGRASLSGSLILGQHLWLQVSSLLLQLHVTVIRQTGKREGLGDKVFATEKAQLV